MTPILVMLHLLVSKALCIGFCVHKQKCWQRVNSKSSLVYAKYCCSLTQSYSSTTVNRQSTPSFCRSDWNHYTQRAQKVSNSQPGGRSLCRCRWNHCRSSTENVAGIQGIHHPTVLSQQLTKKIIKYSEYSEKKYASLSRTIWGWSYTKNIHKVIPDVCCSSVLTS